MTVSPLQLTYKELALIVGDDWHDDRFEVLYDDIPKEGHSSQYMEKGRQYRFFEFLDKVTGESYHFSYIWYEDYPVEFPLSFLSEAPKGIAFVQESVLVPVVPVPVVEKVLTPVQQVDKDLWATYKAVEDQMSLDEKALKKIPKEVWKDILAFMRSKHFSIIEVRAKLVPVMLEYRVHDQLLWTHIQQKLGHWKKPKRT